MDPSNTNGCPKLIFSGLGLSYLGGFFLKLLCLTSCIRQGQLYFADHNHPSCHQFALLLLNIVFCSYGMSYLISKCRILNLFITGFLFLAEIAIFQLATVINQALWYALCCDVCPGNLLLFPGVNLSVLRLQLTTYLL